MRVFPSLILLACLMGCGKADQNPSKAEVDAFVETESLKLVRQKLRAPESATFRDVKVSWKSGKPMACGLVNAENGFGGKAGFQHFISNGGGLAFLEEEMQDGAFDAVAARYC